MEERQTQLAGTLSGGQQQMLAIARALLSKPKLLLLDEPSMGLAPIIVAEIFKIIQEIKEEGTTVLLVEQNAKQALKIADYGYVMETGKIIMEGYAKDLLKDERIVEAYLGKKKTTRIKKELLKSEEKEKLLSHYWRIINSFGYFVNTSTPFSVTTTSSSIRTPATSGFINARFNCKDHSCL